MSVVAKELQEEQDAHIMRELQNVEEKLDQAEDAYEDRRTKTHAAAVKRYKAERDNILRRLGGGAIYNSRRRIQNRALPMNVVLGPSWRQTVEEQQTEIDIMKRQNIQLKPGKRKAKDEVKNAECFSNAKVRKIDKVDDRNLFRNPGMTQEQFNQHKDLYKELLKKTIVAEHGNNRNQPHQLAAVINAAMQELINRPKPTRYSTLGVLEYATTIAGTHGAATIGPNMTPLICACEEGRFEDVKLLITGHDANASGMTLKEMVNQVGRSRNGYSKCTALSAAIGNAHEEIKLYLLKNGGDLDKAYRTEFPKGTPLVCACEQGRFEDVKLLITSGDVSDSNGKILKKKVTKMANKLGRNDNGMYVRPLMIAALNDHLNIVQYLIEQCEANANKIETHHKWNALHFALTNRAWSRDWLRIYNKNTLGVVQLLLDHMTIISINHKDKNEQTPLGIIGSFPLLSTLGSSIKQNIINLIRSKGGKEI